MAYIEETVEGRDSCSADNGSEPVPDWLDIKSMTVVDILYPIMSSHSEFV